MDIQRGLRPRWFGLLVILAALFSLSFSPVARAEDALDPPRQQQLGKYSVEFVTPLLGGNHAAESELLFKFRVTEAGKPVDGLKLNLTAIRDYSGQVKKEHNGPRTPNIGPVALNGSGNGEYTTPLRFGFNGHWYIEVDNGGKDKVRFRLPVGAAENKGAGIGLDWFVWLGVLLTVATIVGVIWRKGHQFPTPVDELKEPVPAPALSLSPETLANRPVEPVQQK